MELNSLCLIIYLCAYVTSESNFDYSDLSNVGTVLFHNSDVNKNKWSREELSLLHSRKTFQNIIPPTDVISSINEEYIYNLLDYFSTAYAHIKREAKDFHTDRILTTALSDTIGGYLKIWALPASKYAYYGGTVSYNAVNKLHEFYDDIKNYLDTDGEGWHSLNEDLLNAIQINMTPRKSKHYTRSMAKPCELIDVYEKTDNDFTIPLPKVIWNDNTGVLFLPIKNQSLLYLTSPNSGHSLTNYYDISTDCLAKNNSKMLTEFNQRFQTWLQQVLVPHLTDDNVYVAFDNVLSLINDTKDLCHKVIQNSASKHCKLKCSKIRIDISSKKILIILILILLECVWCIPAVIYVLFCRKRNKNPDVESKKDDCSKKDEITNYDKDDTSKKYNIHKNDCRKTCGIKINQAPKSNNVDNNKFNYSTNNKSNNDSLSCNQCFDFTDNILPRRFHSNNLKGISDSLEMNTPPVRDLYLSPSRRGLNNTSLNPSLYKLSNHHKSYDTIDDNTSYSYLSTAVTKDAHEMIDLYQNRDKYHIHDESLIFTKKRSNNFCDKNTETYQNFSVISQQAQTTNEVKRNIISKNGEKVLNKDIILYNKDIKIQSNRPHIKININKPNTKIHVDIAERCIMNKKVQRNEISEETHNLFCKQVWVQNQINTKKMISSKCTPIAKLKRKPADDCSIIEKRSSKLSSNKLNISF